MVVEMVQNSTFQNFLHIQHLFIHIQHLYAFSINIYSRSTFIFMQNSTPLYIINSYICSQSYYPFRNFLSIQQFFHSFKIYCAFLLRMEVMYFLQLINRGQRRSANDHWKFQKTPTTFVVLRTFKTLPDYSPTIFH